MEPEFIEIKTEDGLNLPGLFYQAKGAKKVAIYLHGNGSSSVFYGKGRNQIMADQLNKAGISLLMFNNRGAHYIQKFYPERKLYGCAYETIKECVLDIDAAILFLENLGFEEFYLIGSSTGANKICVYHYYQPKNKIKKYVLLGGGDDTGSYFDLLGKGKFQELLKTSKEKVYQGKGEELISDPALYPACIFSYQSFYDIANPDGDYNCFPFYEVLNKIKLSTQPLFNYFKTIDKPTLVIYGQNDEYTWGDTEKVVDILKQQQPDFDYKIIEGADHSFSNPKHLQEVFIKITEWLK